MRIGISAFDLSMDELVAVATAADETGFDTIWIGEHAAVPVGYASEHPTHGHGQPPRTIVRPDTHLNDPFVAVGAISARTRRLKVATGIYLMPLRHPLLTARAAATAQELAQGRFVLGVGSGWLQEEFEALDVPFAGRGRRLEEGVHVLRAAWRGGPFTHSGEHFHCDQIQIRPEAIHVPVVLGGNSEVALDRAARLGDAWFASGTPAFDDAVRFRERVLAVRDRHGLAPFPCSTRISWSERDLLARYEDAGFDSVVVRSDALGAEPGAAAHAAAVRSAARQLGLAA